ncbi:tetratricopeptide repeat protein [Aeromicrobium terrae]|uniref:Tetratricopeptide repeat protein n=1 Tax=Aeromicrobium terrae TaxID=2498846 RepID=A0A5C8NK58_9ACTN|nr:tetratricopeptide repeat protein [Aeromicrobium terrae]TXL60843.1 tetratricopeptide repeat protein [Aeromicrobium terrae]
MDSSIVGALGTGLSVTTFLVGFSSIRLRGQRDRALAHSDSVVRDIIRASSEGRALSDAEVEQSTHGIWEARQIDPVARWGVYFYWTVATLMLILSTVGGLKSDGTFTWNPEDWSADTFTVIFLLILQIGVCSAGTADYRFVQRDLISRLDASSLGIVERAMAARDTGELEQALMLADNLAKRLPSWPWVYAFKGHLLTTLDRPEEALAEFDRAIALRSDDAVARIGRAEHRLVAGDAQGALDDLDALPPSRTSETGVLRLKGSALYKLGRRDEAVALLSSVVRRDPSDADARVARGEALAGPEIHSEHHPSSPIAALGAVVLEEGEKVALSTLSDIGRESLSREDVDTAIQDFTFALEQSPGDRRLLRLRADAYFRNGELEAGRSDYDAAMSGADDTQVAIALRQRGASYRRAGDASEAIADFTASLAVQPTHQAYFYRSLEYEWLGRPTDALTDIDAALGLAPNDDDYLSHRASLLAATGAHAASDALFREIEIRSPSNAHNYYLWLGALLRRGAVIDALALSARAVASCPTDADLRLISAQVRSQNGQVDRALLEIEEARELGAHEAQAAYLAAQVLAGADRMEEAEDRVNRAAEEPSRFRNAALMTRHRIRRLAGNLEGALSDLDVATTLMPNVPAVWVERGCLRMTMDGPTEDALADFNHALTLDANSITALNHLSDYYLRLGDISAAVAAAERSLSLQENSEDRVGLARTLIRAHRWDEAIEVLSDIVRASPSDAEHLWQLAAAYSNSNRFEEAEATFSALVQLDESNLNALAGLAVTISQQERSDDAVRAFRVLREQFGAAAQEWVSTHLFEEFLPKYEVVKADWDSSGKETG